MLSLLILFLIGASNADITRTNMVPGRSTIVHLFEWKWKDIADECERFLAPHGFGGVQPCRPWYERYQVMSYKIVTRSGNEQDFLDMTRRCNKVGVRIYADVVINHMTSLMNKGNVGTGGSTADFNNQQYYAVPYGPNHFHTACDITNYDDVIQTRFCRLVSLDDLNQGTPYVRNKIVEYLNKLVALGVAGIRVDAAKHMYPEDLKVIYDRVNDLNTDFGFAPKTRPYIYQEVAYSGFGHIKHSDYTWLGDVTEFRVGTELNRVFRGQNPLKWLVSYGEKWNLSPSDKVLVFIDNHDTQRNEDVLTYKESRAYKAAIAFMLAYPYGSSRIMSSYFFNTKEQGPPVDGHENILSPTINQDNTCGNGWVCEHRWRQIYQMVAFRNAAGNTGVNNWWDNGNNQIAFSRGNKAFIVFNVEGRDLNETLQTGLPQGEYCDVITGIRQGNGCTGRKVTVDAHGKSVIYVQGNGEDMHLAIHVGPESALAA